MSLSHLTTPLILSFLLGITAHSLFPYAHIPAVWILFALVVSVLGATCAPAPLRADQHSLARTTYLALLAFTLGLYRFSLAQPSLPRGLIFADPKGLAMSADPPHTANHLDPRHWLGRARTTFTTDAYQRFSPDEAALLTGLLYGARDLSKSDKLAFRHAGLTHIIAVSGANMTIIVVLTIHLLLALHLSRRQAFLATVAAVTAFTLFVGPSASVIRAALMGILVEMAPLVGRLVRPTRLLLVSAFVFILWRPWSLAFDPSFALSFLAMLGLLTWGRRFDDRLARTIRSSMLREIVTSTLSATLMTTPYAAWAFGNVTLWSLPTGLVVLPLIPWTMALGSLSLAIPQSLGAIVYLVTISTSGLLKTILWIARVPDHLRFGFFDGQTFPFPWLCVTYVILGVLWHLQSPAKKYPQRGKFDTHLLETPITAKVTQSFSE